MWNENLCKKFFILRRKNLRIDTSKNLILTRPSFNLQNRLKPKNLKKRLKRFANQQVHYWYLTLKHYSFNYVLLSIETKDQPYVRVNLRLRLRIYWVNKLLLCKHLFTLVNMPRQDVINSNVTMVVYFHNVLEKGDVRI